MRIYIPRKIKFGRIAQTKPLGAAGADGYAEMSILSCRDARRYWVNVGNFRNLVGYEPAPTKNSCNEMMKSVTGAVSEVENEPLEGFILEGGVRDGVDLSATAPLGRYPAHAGCAFVRDPRGPLVPVNAGDLASEIMDGRLTIGDGGRLSGSFVWGLVTPDGSHAFPHFRLIGTSGTAFREAKSERDMAIARANITHVPMDKMAYGVVYRQSTSKDPGWTKFSRIVYLGQRRCIPTDLTRKILAYSGYLDPEYHPREVTRILKELMDGGVASGSDGPCLPWKREDWRSVCAAFRKWHESDGLQHVFVRILPVSRRVNGDARVSVSHESSLCLDLLVHVRACSTWNEKSIRDISDDQKIVFVPECVRYDSPYAEEYTADALGCAVGNTSEALERKMVRAMTFFPTEEPESISNYMATLQQLSK